MKTSRLSALVGIQPSPPRYCAVCNRIERRLITPLVELPYLFIASGSVCSARVCGHCYDALCLDLAQDMFAMERYMRNNHLFEQARRANPSPFQHQRVNWSLRAIKPEANDFGAWRERQR